VREQVIVDEHWCQRQTAPIKDSHARKYANEEPYIVLLE